MRPNRPAKSIPSQYCLCFALLGLLIGATYLSIVPFIDPPESSDYWILVAILWVIAGGIVVILVLQYFTRSRTRPQAYKFR